VRDLTPTSGAAQRAERKRGQMSVAELQELEEVKGLIARGQQVGVLTYAEIETATAELDLDETDGEELHGLFERCEIELVEEIDPATAASLSVERASARRTRRSTPPDLKPEGTTDSLQLFLRDIGKVRLLSAPEEVDLAKRIGRGDLDAKQKMVESNLRLVVSIAKKPQPGAAVSRSDPGGHDRFGPRGGEVRLSPGVQILDLCHLVDPPGDRPRAG
jgi:DNA-directed RNA polymerase sigma subunit (sigma70/sigma32)